MAARWCWARWRWRNFANPNGLQQLADTNWSESFSSGDALRGQAGSTGFGLIQSGSLEASNVDITEQLVNMITAQRNFQANAQMIQTADADHPDHHQHQVIAMDRMLYVAMTGARETLRAQTANNHNLANASTTGFRADLSAFQARHVAGDGYQSRAYATAATTGFDDTQGTLMSTGRDLDVAVQGDGYIAVQGLDGREAYTRAGDLRVDTEQASCSPAPAWPCWATAGPIAIPPYALAAPSVVTARCPSCRWARGRRRAPTVARIKLVNPATDDLEKGADGLLRMKDGTRRRRPTPHCASPRACSRPATSTWPTPW